MPVLRERKQAAGQLREADGRAEEKVASASEDEEVSQTSVQVTPPKAASATPVQRKARVAKAVDVNVDHTTLLDIVFKHSSAVPAAAKEWVGRYKSDQAGATAELLTCLVQASGVNHTLTAEEAEEGEVDKLLKSLVVKVMQDGLQEHFKVKGQKAFKGHYLELWDKVIRECYTADILFDDYLVEKLVHLVITLNCSVVRPFRYVATLTACQIVTSFIRVLQTLADARETAQRQLEAEAEKKTSKAGKERMGAFRQTVERCHRRSTELKDIITGIFQAVSAHRFRDVSEDIRAIVIEGITNWIHALPSVFLQDQYLKYVGWALSDKEVVVRLSAITGLLDLYGEQDNVALLRDFTSRFQARFGELIHDVDEAVAIKGVELLALLLSLEEVHHELAQDMYDLLLDGSPAIRSAAAQLVAGSLQERGRQYLMQASPAKGRSKKCKAIEEATDQDLQMAGLIFILSLLHRQEHLAEAAAAGTSRRRASLTPLDATPNSDIINNVVDALFDRVPLLSNWQAFMDILQGDKAVEQYGEFGATALTMVLRDAIIKATGGQLVASRQDPKKVKKGQQQAEEKNRQGITLAFMKSLPGLLRSCQTDGHKVAALVSIPRVFKLEVYSLRGQEAAFESLLRLLEQVMFKHVAADVVRECAYTLTACAANAPKTLQDRAQLIINEAVEEVAQRLASVVDRLLALNDEELEQARDAAENAATSCKQGGAEEDEDMLACRAWLSRLHALVLLSGSAAGPDLVHASLNRLLQALAGGRELGSAISEAAIISAYAALMWRRASLDAAHPVEAAVREISNSRDQLVLQLSEIMDKTENTWVKRVAFRTLADIYLLFGRSKLENTSLASLAWHPPERVLQRFWGYCNEVLREPLPEVPEQKEDESAEERQEWQMAEQRLEQAVQVKQAAVIAIGRLVVFEPTDFCQQLGPKLLVNLVFTECRQNIGALKEVLRLKKADPQRLPKLLLGTVQQAWHERMDAEDLERLAKLLAATYGGAANHPASGSDQAALTAVVKGGVALALEHLPAGGPFFKALGPFAVKLPAATTDAISEDLEHRVAATGAAPVEADAAWNPYFDFLKVLHDRKLGKAGRTPKSALRGKRGGRKHADGRRISFLEDDDGDDEEEDEIEEAEGDEPERLPSLLGTRRPAPVGPGWQSKRQPGDGASPAQGGSKPSAEYCRLAAAASSSDEEEELQEAEQAKDAGTTEDQDLEGQEEEHRAEDALMPFSLEQLPGEAGPATYPSMEQLPGSLPMDNESAPPSEEQLPVLGKRSQPEPTSGIDDIEPPPRLRRRVRV